MEVFQIALLSYKFTGERLVSGEAEEKLVERTQALKGATDAMERGIACQHQTTSQGGAAGPICRAFSSRRLGLPVPRPRSLGYHLSRLRRCFPDRRRAIRA